MSNFDKTLRPQDDYFGYVNNVWLKNNPIPPSESTWGTFLMLRDKSVEAIKNIVDTISKTADNDLTHDQKLIKTFFSTALSYASYKDNHIKTLESELQKIRDITNKKQLSNYLGYAHLYEFSPFWSNYIAIDDKNSQIQVLRIHQGGLCLPNRDYYLDDSVRMKNIRAEYEKYCRNIYKPLLDQSPNIWNDIIKIEIELAKASWTDADLRDIDKNYTKFTIKELQSRFSHINWIEYFNSQGWEKPNDNIIVDQPSFMDNVMNILNSHSLEEIKNYLSWHVVDRLSNWIDESSAELNFNFYEKIINGKIENNPIWKRAVMQANNLIIGEALGREYAAHYFPESSKKTVLEIVEDVRSAYHRRIDKVTWMKDKTKKRAHQKLDNIRVMIGYPSTWKDLSKLKFSNNNHLANILAARSFASDIAIARIGQKPPLEDWYMNAHTVNAYHDPNQLVICFPAAILQSPIYDPNANYATNLGGIGAVIGHELTHGFDDQGAQFDEHGNVCRWQTKTEQAGFKKIADNIVKQADKYEVSPGIFLRGDLVLGEAIADIGGLELAIETLRAKDDKKALNKSLQDLFVNFAMAECGAQRDEYLVLLAKTDPHPPSSFRVNCVVTHVDAFYDVYKVSANDKLYLPPNERVHIW